MSTGTSKDIISSESSLSDDDSNQIGLALSLIWTKLQYKLRTISVSNSMGTITYGKRTERLTVNLVNLQGGKKVLRAWPWLCHRSVSFIRVSLGIYS